MSYPTLYALLAFPQLRFYCRPVRSKTSYRLTPSITAVVQHTRPRGCDATITNERMRLVHPDCRVNSLVIATTIGNIVRGLVCVILTENAPMLRVGDICPTQRVAPSKSIHGDKHCARIEQKNTQVWVATRQRIPEGRQSEVRD
jgi:hypothetical protein